MSLTTRSLDKQFAVHVSQTSKHCNGVHGLATLSGIPVSASGGLWRLQGSLHANSQLIHQYQYNTIYLYYIYIYMIIIITIIIIIIIIMYIIFHLYIYIFIIYIIYIMITSLIHRWCSRSLAEEATMVRDSVIVSAISIALYSFCGLCPLYDFAPISLRLEPIRFCPSKRPWSP